VVLMAGGAGIGVLAFVRAGRAGRAAVLLAGSNWLVVVVLLLLPILVPIRDPLVGCSVGGSCVWGAGAEDMCRESLGKRARSD
jgi:hypothetical protein